jgi:hypothetical protein
MKLAIIFAILLISTVGCSVVKDSQSGPTMNTTNTTTNTTHAISGAQQLILTGQDLAQLEMKSNGTDCMTEDYQTDEYSPVAQYSICSYTINGLNDTQVVIELQKFTNLNDLNGTYQYASLHLRSVEGLLSENDYGDQSRFYVNNENDYGGQYDDPNIHYYTLYICKDKYLIHITSSGSKDAQEYVARIGRQILSKFA